MIFRIYFGDILMLQLSNFNEIDTLEIRKFCEFQFLRFKRPSLYNLCNLAVSFLICVYLYVSTMFNKRLPHRCFLIFFPSQ